MLGAIKRCAGCDANIGCSSSIPGIAPSLHPTMPVSPLRSLVKALPDLAQQLPRVRQPALARHHVLQQLHAHRRRLVQLLQLQHLRSCKHASAVWAACDRQCAPGGGLKAGRRRHAGRLVTRRRRARPPTARSAERRSGRERATVAAAAKLRAAGPGCLGRVVEVIPHAPAARHPGGRQ